MLSPQNIGGPKIVVANSMVSPQNIGGPKIVVANPHALNANAQSGAPQTIEISNPTTETKQWTTNSLPSWLQLNPGAGQISAGAKESLNVSVDQTNLKPGTYKTEVIFSWKGEVPGDVLDVTLVV